jgi:hypothetical protein
MKSKPKKKPASRVKSSKPTKKALTHRQQFQKELEGFEIRVNEKLDAFRQALNGVVERMWKNIQFLDQSGHMTEAHILILRRVMDDGLNSAIVTKKTPMTTREIKDGVETVVESEGVIIDWEHYTSWYMQEQAKRQAAREAAEAAAKEVMEHSKADSTDEQPLVDGRVIEDEVKKEPPAPPQDDGIPEGAAVFGGQD